ncbi:hypothetical protein LX15_000757 [Streptoalloteichus tenebrarius]|uniref:Uncharacterized protein n=2 Tax=Streptoalloteichus tenebrarius (strain ATCC 17920 / DSM 40477 / JCM 4838 / CBS 697.72 / NBRC 16177 / NCIMB 11028 / NRRL B-12390 / A12253. 1 / ISP 5477) TaxID=1933 RepID=A0ABT1HNI4_STRSD|nr:hypothetical protein [Streptoalloteichus tenebrarius]BFE98703.1 hypothetical protein GCM10020241_03790 [Streptoalloteichus tenebrarius]
MPPCRPAGDHCALAVVHRNSDGREYRCETLRDQRGCYTPQLNNNGVTSYAVGLLPTAPHTAYAQTDSYLLSR